MWNVVFFELHYGFRSFWSIADLLLLTGLGLLEQQHLLYLRYWQGLACWSPSHADSIKSYGISDRVYGLFNHSSVINGFEWFSMAILSKNIQLMLEFLKAPFFVLQFSYSALMTFLVMLSVVLLSVLMILFSTLIMIRHLICSNH